MGHAHDLTLLIALVALVAAPFAAWAMGRYRGWIFLSRKPVVAGEMALRANLALLSLGAGAIHFAGAPDRYGESVLPGLAVFALAWFQLLWPFTLSARTAPVREATALLVNAVAVVGWAASVTIGLPARVGDDRLAVDLLAMLFEFTFILGVMGLLIGRQRLARQEVSTRTASLATAVVAVMIIVLTTASIVGAVAHGH